jgi:MFS-type transporter involved in bile tolerance (Atg22 family)
MGTFSFGIVNHLTGDMRNSAMFLAIYFIIGAMTLLGVKASDVTLPGTTT